MRDVRITLVGAGGLGVAAAWGVANCMRGEANVLLRIIDPDTVELSNLHRQVLYHQTDLGTPKAAALARRISERTGWTRIEHSVTALSLENACELLDESDVVLDATDDVPAKFLLNDYCVLEGIRFVHAGAIGAAGQVLAVDPADRAGGCLRCLFGSVSDTDLDGFGASCRAEGILGPAVGAVGFMLGAEGCRLVEGLLVEPRHLVSGSRLVRYDLEKLRFTESTVPASRCSLGCGGGTRHKIDLSSKRCPHTFLYTKIAAEQLPADSLLDVQLGSADAAANVEHSIAEEGYRVVGTARLGPGCFRLLVAHREELPHG